MAIDKRPRFTRITGMLSGVQQDEADLGDPEGYIEDPQDAAEALVRFLRAQGFASANRPDYGPADTFDPLSDPLDDPFPEELR